MTGDQGGLMTWDATTDDLALLRAYEPVLRLTQGEFFVPVGVGGYVAHCTVREQAPDGTVRVVAEPGSVDLESLARLGALVDGPGQSLSAVTVPASRWRRLWIRRPTFRAGARLAQVGLLGRSIDTLSRLSLLMRGAVPGGSAGLSLELQQQHLNPDRPTYHGRVLRDGYWIVCQYWFFYSFNNWRSGFSGVNEHEADWENVTVYLDGSGAVGADGLPEPRWVVFSAHDETGDDLRRRWDDPDLSLVEGRHPVVFAGAGSHSGAYLPGDYLITVAPPSLGGLVPAVRRVAKLLTPWSRAAQGTGLGMPYLDYARGDGVAVGPGESQAWTAVVIGDDTPWVRDYRGLWGHDTRDRLGGERGPAGPRYERDGSVRMSWGDPVGWAGLAKVAPNAALERELVAQRIDEIDRRLGELEDVAARTRGEVAREAAGLPPGSTGVRVLEPQEQQLSATRMSIVGLRDERATMLATLETGLAPASPHAHLRHRRTPIQPPDRGRRHLLTAWSVVSTPLALALIGYLFRPATSSRWEIALLALMAIVSVEAFARGYLLAFLGRLLLLLIVVNSVEVVVLNWQSVLSIGIGLAALLLLVVNLRDVLRR